MLKLATLSGSRTVWRKNVQTYLSGIIKDTLNIKPVNNKNNQAMYPDAWAHLICQELFRIYEDLAREDLDEVCKLLSEFHIKYGHVVQEGKEPFTDDEISEAVNKYFNVPLSSSPDNDFKLMRIANKRVVGLLVDDNTVVRCHRKFFMNIARKEQRKFCDINVLTMELK